MIDKLINISAIFLMVILLPNYAISQIKFSGEIMKGENYKYEISKD